jgi:lactate dehydrogenase-like 2-hydroxyacid dehydrogenase
MHLVFLDADTVGDVPNLTLLEQFGTVTYYPATRTEQVPERIREADVVITNKVMVNATAMAQAPNLKLICVAATGTNNVDKEAAQQRGIPVKNVVNYSSASVAQITFSILLQLLVDVPYFDQYVKTGGYSRNDTFTHLGRGFWELNGKRYGIVGLGNIGQQVARIAAAFGAEVVYYSTSGQNTQQPYTRLELDEFLHTCDVVSIHAPLNERTENLLNYDRLKQMKRSALLINVGRGGIVNEADLARALDEQLIAGAGVDVFTQEPIPANHPLLQVTNREALVLTPHMSWSSLEARILLMERIGENIRSFLSQL